MLRVRYGKSQLHPRFLVRLKTKMVLLLYYCATTVVQSFRALLYFSPVIHYLRYMLQVTRLWDFLIKQRWPQV